MYADPLDDACRRHQLAINSMRKLECELAEYKREITRFRDAGDFDNVSRLRFKMDLLVGSLNVIRHDVDKYECELANAFVDGKPWTDTTSEDSYSY